MGESKFRKETDPNYGKSTKPSSVRGLIINTPIYVNGGDFGTNNIQLNAQELRSALFYWDRLALPSNNIIHVMPGPDVKYLESAGILYQPKVTITGNMAEGLRQIPNKILEHYEKEQPGAWSLGSGDNSIWIMDGKASEQEGTLIQLYNAIPTPAENVPLNEILEFKQLRRAELLALRSHIDKLTVEIHASSDSSEQLTRSLKDIDAACADLIKVCREWQSPVYLGNLKANLNFNIASAIASGAKVWASFEYFQLGLTAKVAATAAAAIQSQIEFKPDIKLQSIKRPSSPFKYVYESQKILS